MIKSQTIGARLGLAMLGAGMLLSAATALAQTGNPGLDSPGEALSRNLRSLAENPKSVFALMGAGKAALQLGDPQAAITFFGRAEEQAPGDGRIKMWLGAALVQLQQAQGALKFFAEATSLGAPEAEVAGHRGLAYDMLGDPRRAQRDYRLALQARPNAEVSRHLALSLAISGEREAALRALEDQLLVRDRAAERTRMFVLALTGDAAGAARAAQASMPRQGAAMTPFLERLPALTPAERALAVHLGHFPSHARNMPVPAPNTYASAAPATTTARAGAPDARQPALGSRTARQSGQRQASSGPPQQVASLERPAETAGRAERSAAGRARVPELVLSTRRSEEAAPQRSAQSRQQPAPQYNPPAQPQVAGAPPAPTERPVQIASTITPPAFQPQQIASVAASPASQPQQIATSSLPPAAQPQQIASVASTPVAQAQPLPSAAAPVPASSTGQQAVTTAAAPPAQLPVQIASVVPSRASPMPGFSLSAGQASAPQQPTSELTSVQEAPPPASGAGDQRGASRLAGIASVIAALPEMAPVEERTTAPQPARSAVAPAVKPLAKPAAPALAAAKKEAPASVVAKKEAPATVVAKKEGPAAAKKPAPAVAKKEAPAAAKKPTAPAEPSRVWVQVAGGADKAALPREFSRLKTKVPKLLAARTAWTTPLKATNRLLVGPFKTAEEAQDFVNELKKADLTGFAWTSEAGQKIEKLAAK